MVRICIVPCGAKKIWDNNPKLGAVAAGKVYVGPFAKKCQEYAMRFYPGEWVILSAKYGFVRPEEVIPGPYNVSFNDPKTKPITVRDLARMAEAKGMMGVDEVIVLGGKNYVDMARAVFKGKVILTPLSDCAGIGYMMGKLNDAILRGKPI